METCSARQLLRSAVLASYCGLLGWGLFRPEAPPQSAWLPQADKLEHLLAFALLAVGVRAVVTSRLASTSWGLLLSAPLMEWLQGVLQPARQFSLLDAAANLTGVLLGLACWQLLSLLLRKSPS